MLQDIISLTKKMIAIKSIAENPQALEKVLELALADLKGFTIERFERNGVKSALVYVSKKRPKKFTVILNGHLDVIPGKEHQYTPQIVGNKLYGAGAMDMKANVACLISVFKLMAPTVSYPLGLQLVTDEEIGGFDGTKYQIEKGVRADFVLAGEPTNFDIVHQAKGILLVKVLARGKTAHGAYPWRGENAILLMNDFLNRLMKAFPTPSKEVWATTVNVSRVATSNQAFNKIPDDCLVELDARYIPKDAKTIVKQFRALLPKGCVLEIVANEPALATDARDSFIKALQVSGEQSLKKELIMRGANGSSDARHYARVGGAGIEFGPVGGGIGSDKEWVSVSSLETYTKILIHFLQSLR